MADPDALPEYDLAVLRLVAGQEPDQRHVWSEAMRSALRRLAAGGLILRSRYGMPPSTDVLITDDGAYVTTRAGRVVLAARADQA